jgi:hypothetical protein
MNAPAPRFGGAGEQRDEDGETEFGTRHDRLGCALGRPLRPPDLAGNAWQRAQPSVSDTGLHVVESGALGVWDLQFVLAEAPRA